MELPSEYEEMLNKLESQITELFSEIHYYQALLTEKENTIIRLTTENRYLKAQMQTVSSRLTPVPAAPEKFKKSSTSRQDSVTVPKPPSEFKPPSYKGQESFTPPPRPPIQNSEPTLATDDENRINKRVCPQCGAMGFAIKEVDDKTRIITYNPRRIYAKKYLCTKCAYSWF